MGKETPSIRKTLAAASKATTLRIHFPEAAAREAGVRLSTAASKPAPTLSMSVSTSASSPDARYLAVSIDLDAPFPSFPFLGPILHGLHVDLVLDAAAADDDGFAPLRSAAAAAVADEEEEKEEEKEEEEWLVPYVGPGPPRPSAAHRYLFMVFAQPPALDAAGIRALLGLGTDVGLMTRMRWDQEAFERRLGLGEVLAGSYFLTRA
ncbi:putative protease inhibitor [Rosellinia necatrix]|uniref:Putative protease inhibitor n=1 Tax=Rosellinia necatrix TaxID=77044 RepID=A0A1S7ULR7_ROSNE|nr:putative protease inhibitor [Rosellinia necatrix]